MNIYTAGEDIQCGSLVYVGKRDGFLYLYNADGADKCSTCRYASKRISFNEYYCQRHAPVQFTIMNSNTDTAKFPVVKGDCLCGDYVRRGD
jgi:hypothetical protein